MQEMRRGVSEEVNQWKRFGRSGIVMALFTPGMNAGRMDNCPLLSGGERMPGMRKEG